MTIEIEIDEAYQPLVSSERLAAAVAQVLAHEFAGGDVTLVVTNNEAITQLNREFLGEEGPTDVLSFPAQEDNEAGVLQPFILPPDMAPYLGDIIIAYPYAAAQATARLSEGAGDAKTAAQASVAAAIADELELLAVHGALHLLGYDHLEPGDEAIMWARQDAILQSLRHV